MPSAADQLYARQILDKLAKSGVVSQRSLSRELGIALGLTNLLIKRLTTRGWIRVVRIRPNVVRYVLTPAGFAQKGRLSRDFLLNSIRFYCEARDRIRQRFLMLSAEWRHDHAGKKRIVFYGAGEVAEIAYICLQETDLHLVGVVDERRRTLFFGLPISAVGSLTASHVSSTPFDRVVVMSLDDSGSVRASLEALKIPPARVFWL